MRKLDHCAWLTLRLSWLIAHPAVLGSLKVLLSFFGTLETHPSPMASALANMTQPQSSTFWVVEKDDYDVHPWVVSAILQQPAPFGVNNQSCKFVSTSVFVHAAAFHSTTQSLPNNQLHFDHPHKTTVYVSAQSLLDAVQSSDLAAVRAALELCNGLDAAPSPLPPMTPPLIEAVCAGRRDCVELLLQRGASLDTRDVAYGARALL